MKAEGALQIDTPRRSRRLNHMGDVLLEEARGMHGRAADAMFQAACTTYEEALALKPDLGEALVGLGCARLAMAGRATNMTQRKALLRQARHALLQAENVCGKAAAYNLACACALEGNLEGCRSWLERARAEMHLPPHEKLVADPDLAAVHGEHWLSALYGGAS